VDFRQFRTFPTIADVEVPEPAAGEVLLKVAGAGACHSDVAIFHEFDADPNRCRAARRRRPDAVPRDQDGVAKAAVVVLTADPM
jgi:NADPH:quinone reductase-like Zn-dependent oxidoreductase